MKNKSELERVLRNEIEMRWEEIKTRERDNYFNSPLSHFPNSVFTGFYRPHCSSIVESYEFFNETKENILRAVGNEKEMNIVLDVVFGKIYSNVINTGDPCDFSQEGYFPRTYIEVRKAIEFTRDINKIKEVLACLKNRNGC